MLKLLVPYCPFIIRQLCKEGNEYVRDFLEYCELINKDLERLKFCYKLSQYFYSDSRIYNHKTYKRIVIRNELLKYINDYRKIKIPQIIIYPDFLCYTLEKVDLPSELYIFLLQYILNPDPNFLIFPIKKINENIEKYMKMIKFPNYSNINNKKDLEDFLNHNFSDYIYLFPIAYIEENNNIKFLVYIKNILYEDNNKYLVIKDNNLTIEKLLDISLSSLDNNLIYEFNISKIRARSTTLEEALKSFYKI